MLHNISPYIIRIWGDFGIRWYSLVYILGFIGLYYFYIWLAKNGKIKNLTPALVDRLIIFLVLGIILGARFFHTFVFEPSYYLSHPVDILKIWHGGLSFHGGLIGGLLAGWIFARKYKIRLLELADGSAIIVGLFLGLGRIANFINGELYGKITDVSWCVDYSKSQYLVNPPDGCRHPSQIYETIYSFFIAGVQYFLFRRDEKRQTKRFGTGFYFYLFITLYGILRFLTTFTRDEPAILGTGIAEAQWFSLFMFIIGAILLIRQGFFSSGSSRKQNRT